MGAFQYYPPFAQQDCQCAALNPSGPLDPSKGVAKYSNAIKIDANDAHNDLSAAEDLVTEYQEIHYVNETE